MKIVIKSRKEIEYMREAGRILAACHREIAKWVQPGVTTLEIDARVEEYLKGAGASPEQKGYKGFPFATCASVNDVVCHGFPDRRPLQAGDVVTIDIVVNKNGWLADSGWTYAVSEPVPAVARLMKDTQQALYKGIAMAKLGNTLGDIGHVIEQEAITGGYGLVKPLVGHGIGNVIHEPPDVPCYGTPGKGRKLKEGMVITIEPVFTLGPFGAVLWGDDGWTISTADGTVGVQYEHTIAITRDGPFILTE
ncbi:methionyl aminopeptidase [Paenibacillus uliginis N3/975]|uniref:Methionine aminopeptidase n=1 Tax=Paenibacillus uliginis N3/975 TaxID=1313296 RepID=A0A1X7HSA4_9BACL|nr:type I methionyl aminopeptidase [Paenibacillus uliginis]SMF91002.1 methionyl aminopeptidase [Paenibacillus uliginis N3/975]